MTLASLERPAAISPATATRLWYTRTEASKVRKFIIADCLADGTVSFADQVSGEVRWYPCVPSDRERQAVEKLFGQRRSGQLRGHVRIELESDRTVLEVRPSSDAPARPSAWFSEADYFLG